MKWIAILRRQCGAMDEDGSDLSDSCQRLHIATRMTQNHRYMKPLRWVAHLPLAILPLLAAGAIKGRRLEPVMESRVRAALAAAGHDWAKPMADGRDIEIRGTAPSSAAREAARRAVLDTFGVRRVTIHAGTVGP